MTKVSMHAVKFWTLSVGWTLDQSSGVEEAASTGGLVSTWKHVQQLSALFTYRGPVRPASLRNAPPPLPPPLQSPNFWSFSRAPLMHELGQKEPDAAVL